MASKYSESEETSSDDGPGFSAGMYMPKGKEWGLEVETVDHRVLILDMDQYLKQQAEIHRVVGTDQSRLSTIRATPAATKLVSKLVNNSGPCNPTSTKEGIESVLAAELTNPLLLELFINGYERDWYRESGAGCLSSTISKWKLTEFGFHNLARFDFVIELSKLKEYLRSVDYRVGFYSRDSFNDYRSIEERSLSWKSQCAKILENDGRAYADAPGCARGGFNSFMRNRLLERRCSEVMGALSNLPKDVLDVTINKFRARYLPDV